MSRFLGIALLMVALSLTVTSQPFTQQDPSKHTGFIWNSRKIGNKKIATLTIRKDEERDRRSISPVEGDDSVHKKRQKSHHHRHHHGEGARTAEQEEVRDTHEGHNSDGRRHEDLSSLEDGHRVRHNNVHPDNAQGEDHMPSLSGILEKKGITLKPSFLESRTSNVRRGNEESRNRNGKKSKRNRVSRRNRNKRLKRKKQKGCRRLKGESRRKCLDAFRQCRNLRKRMRKKCRADVIEAALNEASGTREQSDIFSFLKNITEMSGKEACHYHYLKKCCTRVGLFSEGPDSDMPVVKCHFRKEFLKCMQNQQLYGTCDATYHTWGDMRTLRKKIKEFVWTPSSCLISDVVNEG